MASPGQLTYWLVPGWLILGALVVVAAAVFGRRAYRLYRLIRLGGPDDRRRDVPGRIRAVLVNVLGQRRLLNDFWPGLMHAVIFWGFVVISLGSLELFGRGLFAGFRIPLLTGAPAFYLALDLFQAAVVVAVLYALYRRLVSRPARLTLSADGLVILGLILGLMLSSLLSNAFRLAAAPDPAMAWTPISAGLGRLAAALGAGAGADVALSAALWWLHVGIFLYFLTYLPHSKHLHIFTAAPNVFLRSAEPKGALAVPDLERTETFGAGKVQDLTWKHLLDTVTCTECGRCDAACPATRTGKVLRPRSIILNLQEHLLHEAGPVALAGKEWTGRPMVGEVISEQALWDCTTCRACMEECPVFIEHVPKIVDMRQHLVQVEGRFPKDLQPLFQNLETNASPFPVDPATRGDWAAGLGVRTLAGDPTAEYLYWVGCYGSFDERNRRIATALVKLLQRAGVDFAILGREERCTGDPAKRAGNEYLFQMLARQNVETLNRHGVRKIVTACPHCFNTLRNEYPKLGGHYEVLHHTAFLARLIAEGKLRLTRPVNTTLTYHDPCYLGRHNGVYDAPREVLAAIPGLTVVEMAQSRERSFCCGGGGARAFLEEPEGKRISHERVDQARATGASALGIACPFCMTMLEDGVKAKGLSGDLLPVELTELLLQATEG